MSQNIPIRTIVVEDVPGEKPALEPTKLNSAAASPSIQLFQLIS